MVNLTPSPKLSSTCFQRTPKLHWEFWEVTSYPVVNAEVNCMGLAVMTPNDRQTYSHTSLIRSSKQSICKETDYSFKPPRPVFTLLKHLRDL